jgi:hypothetical protein
MTDRSTSADVRLAPMPSVRMAVALALLGGALGTFLVGLHGLELGSVGGVVLSVAPFGATRIWQWLSRRNGLPRFIGREIAAMVARAALSVAIRLIAPLEPIANTLRKMLRPPVLVISFLLDVLTAFGVNFLSRLLQQIFTPLGLANLAALTLIAINAAGLEIGALACFFGLIAMILVLIVSESENLSRQR